jgi:hypothetical protein
VFQFNSSRGVFLGGLGWAEAKLELSKKYSLLPVGSHRQFLLG